MNKTGENAEVDPGEIFASMFGGGELVYKPPLSSKLTITYREVLRLCEDS